MLGSVLDRIVFRSIVFSKPAVYIASVTNIPPPCLLSPYYIHPESHNSPSSARTCDLAVNPDLSGLALPIELSVDTSIREIISILIRLMRRLVIVRFTLKLLENEAGNDQIIFVGDLSHLLSL